MDLAVRMRQERQEELLLIMSHWAYYPEEASGWDEGTNYCIYVPGKKARFIRTLDRVRTRVEGDRFTYPQRITLNHELEAKPILEQQVEYLQKLLVTADQASGIFSPASFVHKPMVIQYLQCSDAERALLLGKKADEQKLYRVLEKYSSL